MLATSKLAVHDLMQCASALRHVSNQFLDKDLEKVPRETLCRHNGDAHYLSNDKVKPKAWLLARVEP